MEDKQRKTMSIREAAKLVHRKLGTSKRFSEIEKFAVSELLATKLHEMQCQQLEELEEMKRVVRELSEENTRKQASTDAMYSELTQFVKNHASQLTTHAHDMSTTTDILLRMKNRRDGDRLATFIDCLDQVLHQAKKLKQMFVRMVTCSDPQSRNALAKVSNALAHRHVLFYEIDKCYRLLGSKARPSAYTAAVTATSTASQSRRQHRQRVIQSVGTTEVGKAESVVGRRKTTVQSSLYDLLRRRQRGGVTSFMGIISNPDPKNAEIKCLTDRVKELTREVAEYREILAEMREELEQVDAELVELRTVQPSVAMETSAVAIAVA